jgi:hypothetical protein
MEQDWTSVINAHKDEVLNTMREAFAAAVKGEHWYRVCINKDGKVWIHYATDGNEKYVDEVIDMNILAIKTYRGDGWWPENPEWEIEGYESEYDLEDALEQL